MPINKTKQNKTKQNKTSRGYDTKYRRNPIFRRIAFVVLLTFTSSGIFPPSFISSKVYAQTILDLPIPGAMLTISPIVEPPLMKGIKIFADNPLRFDFVIDTGDSKLNKEALKKQSTKLIKYFLASLTVSEKDMWVNLSPYEKDRIIPEEFSTTEMGRDLLAQDYLLKQLTASLTYPENGLGQKFWQRIYAKAKAQYGTTNIPINTFNKVWIVPDKAVVYENGDTAFVVESHLKVMLEQDYLALRENKDNKKLGMDRLKTQDARVLNDLSSEITKEVILPEIEREVNEGENFASLRQVYYSMILATWFKRNLKESLLGKVYVGKNKIEGVDISDKRMREKIYQQYLAAFKAGVYNYIKEDFDTEKQQSIPRKYFSGGMNFVGTVDHAYLATHDSSQVSAPTGELDKYSVQLIPHSLVNKYIKENLPEDLRENPDNIKNYENGNIPSIPIIGLLKATGQFAHIGLGQVYGKPVIYVDADYVDNQEVIAHERYEIEKWEGKRRELGLEPQQMRQWILDHFEEANALAEKWHKEAPAIDHLYAQAGIDPKEIVQNILDQFPETGNEADVNLAAGQSIKRSVRTIAAAMVPLFSFSIAGDSLHRNESMVDSVATVQSDVIDSEVVQGQLNRGQFSLLSKTQKTNFLNNLSVSFKKGEVSPVEVKKFLRGILNNANVLWEKFKAIEFMVKHGMISVNELMNFDWGQFAPLEDAFTGLPALLAEVNSPEAEAQLIAMSRDKNSTYSIYNVVQALGKFRTQKSAERLIEMFNEAYQNRDDELLLILPSSLGQTGTPQAEEFLMEMVKKKSKYVVSVNRGIGLYSLKIERYLDFLLNEALGYIRTDNVQNFLIESSSDKAIWRTSREGAISALGISATQRAVDHLLIEYNRLGIYADEFYLRSITIQALGNTQTSEAESFLLEESRHGSLDAVKALSQFKSKAVENRLIELSFEKNLSDEFYAAVIEALGNLGTPVAEQRLIEMSRFLLGAISVSESFARPPSRSARRYSNHEDNNLYGKLVSVVNALARLGTPQAERCLLDLIARKDLSGRQFLKLNELVIRLLGESGSQSAVNVLLDLISSESTSSELKSGIMDSLYGLIGYRSVDLILERMKIANYKTAEIIKLTIRDFLGKQFSQVLNSNNKGKSIPEINRAFLKRLDKNPSAILAIISLPFDDVFFSDAYSYAKELASRNRQDMVSYFISQGRESLLTDFLLAVRKLGALKNVLASFKGNPAELTNILFSPQAVEFWLANPLDFGEILFAVLDSPNQALQKAVKVRIAELAKNNLRLAILIEMFVKYNNSFLYLQQYVQQYEVQDKILQDLYSSNIDDIKRNPVLNGQDDRSRNRYTDLMKRILIQILQKIEKPHLAQTELLEMYRGESIREIKREIIQAFLVWPRAEAIENLLAVYKEEDDGKLKSAIIEILGNNFGVQPLFQLRKEELDVSLRGNMADIVYLRHSGNQELIGEIMDWFIEEGNDPIRNRLIQVIYRQLGENGIKLLEERIESVNSQSKRQELYESVDDYRKASALRMVRKINDLHEQPDDIRFDSVKGASAKLLYNLMVYGEEEIFTSSFNGLFNRLMATMKTDGILGDQLVDRKFRIFIKLLAGFNRLNEFLATMSPAQGNALLEKFVSNLDQEPDPVGQAVVIADTFGMITDPVRLRLLQETIQREYKRVKQAGNENVTALYGLLSGMFGEKAVIDQEWFAEMAKRYQLVEVDKVSAKRMFNKDGTNIQRYFFYNDDDGRNSYQNFVSFYQGKNGWSIKEGNLYTVISKKVNGKQIIMYANKPDQEAKGNQEIDEVLKKNNQTVHVIVHRGHSYHASDTISNINQDTVVVILGSCGGYNNIMTVLARSPNAHIVSTKGTGTMAVNDVVIWEFNGDHLSTFPLGTVVESALGTDMVDSASLAEVGNEMSFTNLSNQIREEDPIAIQSLMRTNDPYLHHNGGRYFSVVIGKEQELKTGITIEINGQTVQVHTEFENFAGREELRRIWIRYSDGRYEELVFNLGVYQRLIPHDPAENNVLVKEHFDESARDNALLAENPQTKEQDVGGIDLDPNKLNLQTQGRGMKFIPNFDLNHLERFPINGFSPIIFQTVPVTDLPLFLGLTEDQLKQLSAVR